MPVEPVPDDLDGERVDLVLARLAAVARSVAREMIEQGEATYDGEQVAPKTKARAGVELSYPEIPEFVFEPDPDVSFGVLFEDEYLAVIDKPAGLVVHATAKKRMTFAADLDVKYRCNSHPLAII